MTAPSRSRVPLSWCLAEEPHEGPCTRRDPPGLVVNDMEVSLNGDASEPQGAEPARGHFSADRMD
jgi:hypothetical protein